MVLTWLMVIPHDMRIYNECEASWNPNMIFSFGYAFATDILM